MIWAGAETLLYQKRRDFKKLIYVAAKIENFLAMKVAKSAIEGQEVSKGTTKLNYTKLDMIR